MVLEVLHFDSCAPSSIRASRPNEASQTPPAVPSSHCVALTRPLLPSGSLHPPVILERPHPLFTSGAPLHMAKPVPTRGLGEKQIHHLASFSDSPRDSRLLGRQCLSHLLTPNPAGTESASLAALRLFLIIRLSAGELAVHHLHSLQGWLFRASLFNSVPRTWSEPSGKLKPQGRPPSGGLPRARAVLCLPLLLCVLRPWVLARPPLQGSGGQGAEAAGR